MNISDRRGIVIDEIMHNEKYVDGITLEELYKEVKKHLLYNELFRRANINNRNQYKNSIRALLQHQSTNMKHSKGKHNRFVFLGQSTYTYAENRSKNIKKLLENVKKINNDIKEVNNLPNLNKEEKTTLIKQRLNQGYFRKSLISEFQSTDPIKKVDDQSLLIASHIVDYKDCKEELDRANPYNGLLLSPDVDKLFDKKYISFDKNGKILIIDKKHESNIRKMGIKNNHSLDKNYLTKYRVEYLIKRNKLYGFK